MSRKDFLSVGGWRPDRSLCVGAFDACAYDNALAETINGLYKAEVIEHEGPWSGKTDVEMATLEWVHWYNEKRLYGPPGYISPATAERNFYNAELTAKIAAE
ncbi:MAG: transposase [Defluviimonas sp.]|nr:transposase [Defluviimonas sp.]